MSFESSITSCCLTPWPDSTGAREKIKTRLLGVLCLALASAGEAKGAGAAGKLDACKGKKIYIMDIAMFAKDNGVPICNLATVRQSRALMWRAFRLLYGQLQQRYLVASLLWQYLCC